MKITESSIEAIATKQLSSTTEPNHAWWDQLSPILFWDVDRKTVDPVKHTSWLIERVLEKGQWEDWILLRNNIQKETLAKLAPHLHVDSKARNFLERYLCKS